MPLVAAANACIAACRPARKSFTDVGPQLFWRALSICHVGFRLSGISVETGRQ
jgi:hypothetical protein